MNVPNVEKKSDNWKL